MDLHVNFQYITSIDDQMIFYKTTRCYVGCEYYDSFAIAAGYIILNAQRRCACGALTFGDAQ